MSELKSNDLFTGEICYEYEPLSECFKFSIQDDKGVILGAWNEEVADFACTAIGSYYANQDLITKQAEQIKILRTAVESVISKIEILDDTAMGTSRMHGVAPWSVKNEMLHNLDSALEATKPVEE